MRSVVATKRVSIPTARRLTAGDDRPGGLSHNLAILKLGDAD
jgi:hypothetical protein